MALPKPENKNCVPDPHYSFSRLISAAAASPFKKWHGNFLVVDEMTHKFFTYFVLFLFYRKVINLSELYF